MSAAGVTEGSLRSLTRWNLALALLYLGQTVAVFTLATEMHDRFREIHSSHDCTVRYRIPGSRGNMG